MNEYLNSKDGAAVVFEQLASAQCDSASRFSFVGGILTQRNIVVVKNGTRRQRDAFFTAVSTPWRTHARPLSLPLDHIVV